MSTRSPPLLAHVAELEADRDKAYRYAKRFLSSFVEQNFPPNPDWRPLPDLLGVLTQIDNASTIARDLRARVAELEKTVVNLVEANVGMAAERDEACVRVAELEAALKSAQHLIRNLGGQHGELLDQIDAALAKESRK